MDGAAYNSLIGLPALVIPSGFTTSSALVVASLPHKLMDVLCLLCKWRSCALRLEPNWPLRWKVASCVPPWALVCVFGISVLCHQLRELLCSHASICWTQKVLLPSRSHMDPKPSPKLTVTQLHCGKFQPCSTKFLKVAGFHIRFCGFACFPPMERSKWWSIVAWLRCEPFRLMADRRIAKKSSSRDNALESAVWWAMVNKWLPVVTMFVILEKVHTISNSQIFILSLASQILPAGSTWKLWMV